MGMRSAATTPRAVWGLWIFFTTATLGFVILLAGALEARPTAILTGAALMAFSTLVYLFIHFWTTARIALEPAAAPMPTPSPTSAARRAVSQPAPRSDRPSDANPFHYPLEPLVSRAATHAPPPARAVEQELVAIGAPTAAADREHDRRAFVPAAERRQEWIGDLPIIKEVLGTSAPRAGKTRGQCTGCRTILWAPAERPIRLRCPVCAKVAWLEA
jgi:hypothetical protein